MFLQKVRILVLFALTAFFSFSGSAHAGFFEKLQTLIPSGGSSGGSGSSTVASGLKEALRFGIDAAVKSAGQTDGFLNNPEIKIPFPKKLALIETSFRKIGLGSTIDQFEASMNHAAEAAAPLAKDILLDALKQMTFEDAKKILSGGDTAATLYFQEKTSPKLIEIFKPKIQKSLSDYKVAQQYNGLVKRYQTINLVGKPNLVPIDEYVASQTIKGLFTLVGEEERKIRTDPAARVSQLLKTVFGPARQ